MSFATPFHLRNCARADHAASVAAVGQTKYAANRRHVEINPEPLTPSCLGWSLARLMIPGAVTLARSMSPRPDMARLFFELALTISQFGGFVGHREDGPYKMWKLAGIWHQGHIADDGWHTERRQSARRRHHIGFRSRARPLLPEGTIWSARLEMLKEVAAPSSRGFLL